MKNSRNCRVGPSGELVSDEFAGRTTRRQGRWNGKSEDIVRGNEAGRGWTAETHSQRISSAAMFHILPTISFKRPLVSVFLLQFLPLPAIWIRQMSFGSSVSSLCPSPRTLRVPSAVSVLKGPFLRLNKSPYRGARCCTETGDLRVYIWRTIIRRCISANVDQ